MLSPAQRCTFRVCEEAFVLCWIVPRRKGLDHVETLRAVIFCEGARKLGEHCVQETPDVSVRHISVFNRIGQWELQLLEKKLPLHQEQLMALLILHLCQPEVREGDPIVRLPPPRLQLSKALLCAAHQLCDSLLIKSA